MRFLLRVFAVVLLSLRVTSAVEPLSTRSVSFFSSLVRSESDNYALQITHAVSGTDDVTYGCSADQSLSQSNKLINADNYNVSMHVSLFSSSLTSMIVVLCHPGVPEHPVLGGLNMYLGIGKETV